MILRKNLSNAVRLAIRRSGLAPLLRRLIRRGSLSSSLALGKSRGWDAVAEEMLRRPARSILAIDQLHHDLRADSNFDVDTEFLLVALRRRLLLAGSDVADDPATRETLSTLAQQALNNSFVWSVSGAERSTIAARLAQVQDQMRAGAAPDWLPVAQLCMYHRPDEVLGDVRRARVALPQLRTACTSFGAFVESYLDARERELTLRTSVESLGPPRPASEKVAELYEAHPYPRWVVLRESSFVPQRQALRAYFSDVELGFLDRPFKLLIAGCGTGYEVIHAARTYPNAQITAVDVSRASLGYAAMMVERYRVGNVRLLQMDLLDLPSLGETFDSVRSIGVLHHLRSPLEGGAAITRTVRSGGILHFSLYSSLARRELVRLRATYGFSPDLSDDDVRHLRSRVLTEEPETVEERLPLRADFFDLDRCRDLLCHPQEHTFSVPELARLVDHWGLEFRGIARPPVVRSQYWTRFPPPRAVRDWHQWQRFEERHPDAFASLYQIWLRKP